MGSMAHYGYRIIKLPGEKGNSLCIEPEDAKVVRMIYDMYGQQGMGYNAIAYRLNDLNIPARKAQWSQTSIVNILTNEVYLGKIRWRYEPVKRVIRDGMMSKKRILNDDYELFDGRHEPIITQEQWDRVRAVQEKRGHHSTHTTKELQNPFVGILYCGKCGTRQKESGAQADRDALAIIPAMQHILDNYSVLTVSEKNRLWKLVLQKATVYRTPDGELSVHIYPNLPK